MQMQLDLDLEMDSYNEVVAKSSVRYRQEGQHYQMENNPRCTTSLRFTFTWVVEEVQQKRKPIPYIYYSRPFYTAPNGPGYKMCLMLFMDGDGSGQGTHISFYAALMRGEHDSHLQWPFKKKVTLVLVSQDQQQQDIVKTVHPDPREFDGSFWQPSPNCNMNIPFGFPQFAPISVLQNGPVYVTENDSIVFKCIIETWFFFLCCKSYLYYGMA